MLKISELPSPAIAGVIRSKTKNQAIAGIKNCVYDGATMIDLHLSCLENADVQTLRDIFASTRLPVLALNYNQKCDWSDAGYTEEQRVHSFFTAVEAGAAGVDMQGHTFEQQSKNGFHGEDKYSFTHGNPREIVTDECVIEKQCAFIEEIHARGAQVLLSCHPGIFLNAETVTELALFLEKRNPDIIKIVSIAETEEQLIESFKSMLFLKKHVKTKVSYHAAGICGRLSRLINPVLGGHIAFCVDRFGENSTMEQLDLKTAATVIESLKKMQY